MSLTLRGHHLLCVHGFRGMGYSPDFIIKMSEIVEDIRNGQLDYPIKVVDSLDDTCGACPHKGELTCQAGEGSNEHVVSMDRRVIRQLGLEAGTVYEKSDLVKWTAEKVKPDNLDALCKGCSWLAYGVCKEGIAALNEEYA